MIKAEGGADASTLAIIKFTQESGDIVHGILNCSMTRRTNERRAVIVECSKGFLEIEWAAYRPEAIAWKVFASIDAMQNSEQPIVNERLEFSSRPGDIWGFGWEADEVARCIFAGKLQSERMPWRDSVLEMEVRISRCEIELD